MDSSRARALLRDAYWFQAEYLFKKNPEGKMFEPDFTESMSMILKTIHMQEEDVFPEAGLDDDLAQILQPEELLVSDISETIIENDVREKKPSPVPSIPEPITEIEYEFEDESLFKTNDEDNA